MEVRVFVRNLLDTLSSSLGYGDCKRGKIVLVLCV